MVKEIRNRRKSKRSTQDVEKSYIDIKEISEDIQKLYGYQ